jgi:hypothetical protein
MPWLFVMLARICKSGIWADIFILLHSNLTGYKMRSRLTWRQKPEADVCSVPRSWKSRSSVGVPQLEVSVLLSGVAILAIDVVWLCSFSCIYMLRAHNRLAQTFCARWNWLECLSPAHVKFLWQTFLASLLWALNIYSGEQPQWYHVYRLNYT